MHLHGRADEPQSLVHVIRSVGRGLRPDMSERARLALNERTVLVVGYSGNDDDIMTLLTKANSADLVWAVRDENDRAYENVGRRRAFLPNIEFVTLDLRDIERRMSGVKRSNPISSD